MIEVPYSIVYGGTVLLVVLVSVVIFQLGEIRTLNTWITVLREQCDTWNTISRCKEYDE